VTGGTEEARRLAGSWLSPAGIETSGLFEGYAYSERAYHLRATTPGPLSVRVSPTRPVVNPVFRIYRWPGHAQVALNGKALATDQFRAQLSGEDLLVWLDRTLDKEATIEIAAG